MTTALFHPASTFVFGVIAALVLVAIVLYRANGTNASPAAVAEYRAALEKSPGDAVERAALERFTEFLGQIGSADLIRRRTGEIYAADAFFNDTLVTHRGAAAIEKHFLQTSDAMTSYEVAIDDIAVSDADHYIRWTMVFASPALASGSPIHSTGVSQVRFDADGKVVFHQDFWDSGAHFFGHAPVTGGLIHLIRNRLK